MTFIDYQTIVPADWLNFVNAFVNTPSKFQVVSSISSLRAISSTSTPCVFVSGYYNAGDGGGGNYFLVPSDTTSPDNGGTIIVGADGGRWYLQWFGQVTVLQFGAKADAGTTDNSTVLANCAAWVASGAIQNKLVFPAGIYGYSVSPNWAIPNAQIESQGEVRLRYSGTGNAVILDTGPTVNTFTYNVTMGSFIVEAPSTAGHGVYIRSIHHSVLRFKVEGAGSNSDGIRVEFAVCTDFDNCSVTANEAGNWYLGAMPKNGLHFTFRDITEPVSYCKVDNLICEGLAASGGAGILLEGALGNQFYGGTAEACDFGLLTGTQANWNKFFGVDFEANNSFDVFDQGFGTELHGCDTMTLINISGVARWPKIFGGNHQSITVGAGCVKCTLSDLVYHRVSGTGAINDNATDTIKHNLMDAQTQKLGGFTQGLVATPASGVPYTNNTGVPQFVSIIANGAAITAITITRNAVNNNLATTTTNVTLAPGDGLSMLYTIATPILYVYSE